jgi:hypothetical protein
MNRKQIAGLVFTSVLALAAGCSSKPKGDLPVSDEGRDFSEYNRYGRAAQVGYGDMVGSQIVARDEPGTYNKVAPAKRAAQPAAHPSDVASTDQD